MTLNFALNTVFAQMHQAFDKLSLRFNPTNSLITGSAAIGATSFFPNLGRLKTTASSVLGSISTATILAQSPQKHKNTLSTGFDALDAALPGGGWPVSGAVEIIADDFAFSELSVFLPLLQRTTQAQEQVAWISPPHHPHLRTLQAEGIATDHLQIVMASGYTSFWAASKAVKAGNAKVILYWPDGSVSAAQRKKLAADAANSGILLFLLHANAFSTETIELLRVRLSGSAPADPQTNVAICGLETVTMPIFKSSGASIQVENLHDTTAAIVFDKQRRKASSNKQKQTKLASFPSLNGIGYTSSNSGEEAAKRLKSAHTASAHLGAATQSPAEAWVTIETNGRSEQIALRASRAPLAFHLPSAQHTATQTAATEVESNLSATPPSFSSKSADPTQTPSESTLSNASRSPILGHLQTNTSTPEQTRISNLEKNRLDALRLPRAIVINMPSGANATIKLCTPSRRARDLALRSLKTAVAAPIVGQPLLRKLARNSANARVGQQSSNAIHYGQQITKHKTAQLSQAQLA